MSGTKGARGSRFEGGLADVAQAMNASVDFDRRLLSHDVAGSTAHARMLAAVGVISQADAEAIAAGLATVRDQLATGAVPWEPALEDVHMNVEARLIDAIGDAGRRLHTGRSRNDQVALDLRLYARAATVSLDAACQRLQRALVDQAARHVDTLMPGYTHLQRAQPIRAAHHFLAYVEMLGRDRARLVDAGRRAAVSPLGSGALAATTFPIDRAAVAQALDLPDLTHNSLDAVGDRDFAIELVATCALIGAHLSRLGEELVLWTSQEFGFARLSDAWCSGSSLMPQKKNPDLAELLRAKVGRVIGAWVTLMTVVKGLPLAYNKDLQETQEPLYDAVETTAACLDVAAGMIGSLELDVDVVRAAVDRGYLVATELADYLVAKGAAFRDAHDVAGGLVRAAVAAGRELADLTLPELQAADARFADDVYAWLDPARAVDRRDVVGGPARPRIEAEIARHRAALGAQP
ncbi:MAG: argininosuccinate lyase [Kofleriaceae bacterium]